MRPVLGIAPSQSTKGMGFIARAHLRLCDATRSPQWCDKARSILEWLVQNQCSGYAGACCANHFDYQSRSGYLPKGVPTVVWTSLIGHAFLDAYDRFGDETFLKVAVSSCEHIVRDLEAFPHGDSVCIAYVPKHMHDPSRVHNASVLGAGLLARTYSHTRCEPYRALAEAAIRYTTRHQRPDGSWFYGESLILHWVDNFHTAYVLDSLKHYLDGTGDQTVLAPLMKGYQYWRNTFFLEDGTPKYYNTRTLPIDIQCCAQALDTLVWFRELDPESVVLAKKVAKWTIEHMQDPAGFFYYRRYSRRIVNKTPTLHWGQATMLSGLAALYSVL